MLGGAALGPCLVDEGDKQGAYSQEGAGEAHGAGELNNGSFQFPLHCQARVTFPDQNQPLSGK